MSRRGKKRIYIAGPMTGYPNCNFPAFDQASKLYRANGWAVHNPASSFDGDLSLPYEMYMEAAIGLLVQSDAIALLPGWFDSKGASMEALIAQQMGLDFYRGDRVQRLVITHPLRVIGGEFRGATTASSLASRLEAVVEALPEETTVDTLRTKALRLGLLDEEKVKPAVAAAGLSKALRDNGYDPTENFIRSGRSRHPVRVWSR